MNNNEIERWWKKNRIQLCASNLLFIFLNILDGVNKIHLFIIVLIFFLQYKKRNGSDLQQSQIFKFYIYISTYKVKLFVLLYINTVV